MESSSSSLSSPSLSSNGSGVVNSSSSDNNNNNSTVNWFGVSLPFRSPVSFVIDYWNSSSDSAEPVVVSPNSRPRSRIQSDSGGGGAVEVAISIVGRGDQLGTSSSENQVGELGCEEEIMSGERVRVAMSAEDRRAFAADNVPLVALPNAMSGIPRDSSSPYGRLDVQQIAKWSEQILPFALLLLIVFVRQHWQGNAFLGFFSLILILILASNGSAYWIGLDWVVSDI